MLTVKKYVNPTNFLKQMSAMPAATSVKKRASFCLSKKLKARMLRARMLRARMLNASMTVEAAFVLPFFLFAFLNIISIIEIYRVQANMSAAMHMASKEMAVGAYEYRAVFKGDAGKLESLGLSYGYAANRVGKILGHEYLKNSPIKGGFSGIGWYRSSVLEKDDCIDLIAVYAIKPPAAVVGFGGFNMYNRAFARAWTGYDNAAAAAREGGEEMVYITPDGTVYHQSIVCTYLKLSIAAADKTALENKRNEGGAKYYPCEECGSAERNMVYITGYGTRYHSSLQCSKLKRTILTVPISEAGGRGACIKCSVKSASNRLQQRLLREEALCFTREKRKDGVFHN